MVIFSELPSEILILGQGPEYLANFSMEYYCPVNPGVNRLSATTPWTEWSWHASVLMPDGRILITGGKLKKRPSAFFDPKTRTFQNGTDMIETRYFPAAAVLNNLAYICGGSERSCERLDGNEWTRTIKSMKKGRNQFAMVAFDGCLYAMGVTITINSSPRFYIIILKATAGSLWPACWWREGPWQPACLIA